MGCFCPYLAVFECSWHLLTVCDCFRISVAWFDCFFSWFWTISTILAYILVDHIFYQFCLFFLTILIVDCFYCICPFAFLTALFCFKKIRMWLGFFVLSVFGFFLPYSVCFGSHSCRLFLPLVTVFGNVFFLLFWLILSASINFYCFWSWLFVTAATVLTVLIVMVCFDYSCLFLSIFGYRLIVCGCFPKFLTGLVVDFAGFGRLHYFGWFWTLLSRLWKI